MTMLHLMIRGYLGRVMQFAQPWEIAEDDLDTVVPTLAVQHATAMAEGRLGMLEIEFLDEPDVNQRFFRIGVDPSGMVRPMELHLREPS